MRRDLDQMGQILAENQRLTSLVAQTKTSPSQEKAATDSPPASDDVATEITRLRAEAETLRRQSAELEKLRADTRQARNSLQSAIAAERARRSASGSGPNANHNPSALEIVSANYWTDKTNLDVADELRDRIRGDILKAVASNNLKGDPHFGEVKHLTVIYRAGGVLMTNEFREGDVIVIPKPIEPN